MRRLRGEGCSILYISHKLDEIRALCDTATILRGGKRVGECDPRQKSVQELAHMMIGETPLKPDRPGRRGDARRERLQVDNLSMASSHAFGTALHQVSFSVAQGEILGIAGVAGNGQPELMEALIGETLSAPNAIRIDDAAVGQLGPRRRRGLGACFVPEERIGHATAPYMTLGDNGLLSADRRMGLASGGWIRPGLRDGFAAGVITRFGVKAGGSGDAAKSLSGGNLQKFSVGREIAQEPSVLVINQPTWGVDAGSAAAIQGGIIDLAAQGAAVVVISQDLDELFALSDRIAVMSDGRLSEAMPVESVDIEKIGMLMGGVRESHAEAGA